jgi:hypothetical protein
MRLLTSLGALVICLSGCSVKLLDQNETPSVANTCHANSDCGAGATCDQGACITSTGTIDQVLVEVTPDSRSEFGGLSFVSTLDGVQSGDHNRAIDLPATMSFVPQVRGDLANFPNCPADMGVQQLGALVQYTRVSSVGDVPILGLPQPTVTVDSPGHTVSLVPGTYDIYVKPSIDPAVLDKNKGCEIGPYMLRGVVVEEGAPSSGPHATIDLPKPVVLDGTVLRAKGGTLVGWNLDIVEPQEGRVISTLGPVGAVTGMNMVTNFKTITYLLPSLSQSVTSPAVKNPSAGSPLVRLTPPPEMISSAPTVYWDLAAADINGVDANGHEKVSLDMSGVPIPDQLIDVTGQVKNGKGDLGVRANVRFFSISLEGALGITAVFNPSAVTDDQGHYTIKLFPGQYRVVATPDVTTQDALMPPTTSAPAPSGASVASPWAITEIPQVPISKTTAVRDIQLNPKINLRGTALSDPNGAPAMGATFEADPSILLTKVGVLRSALAQTPALPPSASVPIVDDKTGAFSLPVDPGDFDLSLRPSDTSNFAWWVSPAQQIDSTRASTSLMTRLMLPVPIEGTITVHDLSDPNDPNKRTILSNATVSAYAKVPSGTGVTKVGETRTDDQGHYRLGLPARFGQ